VCVCVLSVCVYIALRATNEAGDRTRVIVYLRCVMNLTTQTYYSKVRERVWQGESMVSVCSDSSVLEEADIIASLPEDSDSDSQRESDEYEWEGPPGDIFFPELSSHYPQGRWVRTQKGLELAAARKAQKQQQREALPPVPHSRTHPEQQAQKRKLLGGQSGEAESSGSSEVLVTVPPGPYVPDWLRAEARSMDDNDQDIDGNDQDGPQRAASLSASSRDNEDRGGGGGGGAAAAAAHMPYLDVGQYFLAQKEDAAADFQLLAQVHVMCQ
jgi:hypothetical protein